jgi:hypothetical protein
MIAGEPVGEIATRGVDRALVDPRGIGMVARG